jgi:hypothetical protein
MKTRGSEEFNRLQGLVMLACKANSTLGKKQTRLNVRILRRAVLDHTSTTSNSASVDHTHSHSDEIGMGTNLCQYVLDSLSEDGRLVKTSAKDSYVLGVQGGGGQAHSKHQGIGMEGGNEGEDGDDGIEQDINEHVPDSLSQQLAAWEVSRNKYDFHYVEKIVSAAACGPAPAPLLLHFHFHFHYKQHY